MNDWIYFEDLILSLHIGCNTAERSRTQPVRLNIWMNYDTQAAGHSDKLKDTLDYAEAYRKIQAIADEQAYGLLERFCQRVAEALLQMGASTVRINACKDCCPIPGMKGQVGVEIFRSKDGSLK